MAGGVDVPVTVSLKQVTGVPYRANESVARLHKPVGPRAGLLYERCIPGAHMRTLQFKSVAVKPGLGRGSSPGILQPPMPRKHLTGQPWRRDERCPAFVFAKHKAPLQSFRDRM